MNTKEYMTPKQRRDAANAPRKATMGWNSDADVWPGDTCDPYVAVAIGMVRPVLSGHLSYIVWEVRR